MHVMPAGAVTTPVVQSNAYTAYRGYSRVVVLVPAYRTRYYIRRTIVRPVQATSIPECACSSNSLGSNTNSNLTVPAEPEIIRDGAGEANVIDQSFQPGAIDSGGETSSNVLATEESSTAHEPANSDTEDNRSVDQPGAESDSPGDQQLPEPKEIVPQRQI